eukprot:436336_1
MLFTYSTFAVLVIVFIHYGECNKVISSDELKEWKAKNYKIGIIGGGASGLTVAYKLNTEYGINNIDIYEKESEPSESAITVEIGSDGPVDLGTIVWPRATYDIINPDNDQYQIDFETDQYFASLLEKYNLNRYELAVGYLNITSRESSDSVWLTSFLEENHYTPDQMISEIIQTLLIYEQIKLMNDDIYNIDDYYKYGFTVKGETLNDLGNRLNLPIASFMHNYFCDTNGGVGPCATSWSSSAQLNYQVKWRTGFWSRLLYSFGYRYGDFTQYPFVNELLNDPNIESAPYFALREGFQSLWDSMSDELIEKGVNIQYNTQVVHLSNGNYYKNKFAVSFSNLCTKKRKVKTKKYDKIFVAVSPDDAVKFLDMNDFPDEYSLYTNTYFTPWISAVYNIHTKPAWIDNSGMDVDNVHVYVVYPYAINNGKKPEDGFSDLYNCSIYFNGIFDHGTNMSLWAYVTPDNFDRFDEPKKENAKIWCTEKFHEQLMNDYQVSEFDETFTKVVSLGPRPLVDAELNDWYELLHNIQGNPLYHVSGVVTGYTVVNVNWWINKNVG